MGSSSSLENERQPLIQSAFLNAKLFKQLFGTFRGDDVSKARIKQTASGLKVHPDSTDECADLFMDGLVVSGLGVRAGDNVKLVDAAGVSLTEDSNEIDDSQETPASNDAREKKPKSSGGKEEESEPQRKSGKAGVNVTLNVDSSSDPDKLQKQLELLRKFGVI